MTRVLNICILLHVAKKFKFINKNNSLEGDIMRKSLSKFVFTVLVGSFLVLPFLTVQSQAQNSCFPTCSSTDGRFLVLAEGGAFETLTPESINVRIIVPGEFEEFSIGVFDGEQNGNTDGVLNWDAGTGVEEPYSYVLVADPDRDNDGPEVFMAHSDDMLNNEWVDFTISNDPSALDADGNYVYTLTVTLLSNVQTENAFKLRTDVGFIVIDEIFTFLANMGTFEDFLIIFPNADFTDGTIDPSDLVNPTYDGTFSFFFDIPEPAAELAFWDGDSDRGSYNTMADWDTDDQNTPNVVPPFAPADADTEPEGVNPPDPFDDIDPSGGPLGTNELYVRPGPVRYQLRAPDGQVWSNPNPSGNKEWENFVISTLTTDPNVVDFATTDIPAGTYEIRFEDLDMGNLVSINPLFPLVLRGEGPPPPGSGGGGGGGGNGNGASPVPTMSEWGLIAVAVFMGLIGIAVVRRKQRLS